MPKEDEVEAFVVKVRRLTARVKNLPEYVELIAQGAEIKIEVIAKDLASKGGHCEL